MIPASLEDALKHYETQLLILEKKGSDLSPEAILELLLTRDGVDEVLQNSPATDHPTTHLLTLAHLDERLKQQAEAIAKTTDLRHWRDSFRPPKTAWWWWFEVSPTPYHWDRFDWLWGAISVSCLTVALSLVGDISSRFLVGGPDTFGALAVSTQSVLTLLAGGSALTKAGREANQRILVSLNIPRYFWHEISAVFSTLVLVGLVVFRLSLPQLAEQYNEWGYENFEEGQLTSAEYSYKRALRLNPDNIAAHYLLGLLYERLTQLDLARNEYQIAVQGNFIPAYNNLARLYILAGEPDTATVLLRQGFVLLEPIEQIDRIQQIEDVAERQAAFQFLGFDPAQAETERSAILQTLGLQSGEAGIADVRYFMHKNLGWALLAQEDYVDAKTELTTAIEIAEQIPIDAVAAHCLLAQVLEAQGQLEAALAEWVTCLSQASLEDSDEAVWIKMARERLTAQKLPE